MKTRHVLAITGALSGLGVPFLGLLWRAFSSRRAWWLGWLQTELSQEYGVYVFFAVVSVAFLAAIGYLIGWKNDQWISESQRALNTNLELSYQATTDPLTGLLNGRAIHDRLDSELENSHRSHLTCLLIDVDHFKRVNDKYGHPFGDTVLIAIAQVLRRSVRRIDAVARLGGEEFVIVLPGLTSERGAEVAERVRQAIQSEEIYCDKTRVKITVSVGSATYPTTTIREKSSLVKAADDALYQAKRGGRNRVVVAPDDTATDTATTSASTAA